MIGAVGFAAGSMAAAQEANERRILAVQAENDRRLADRQISLLRWQEDRARHGLPPVFLHGQNLYGYSAVRPDPACVVSSASSQTLVVDRVMGLRTRDITSQLGEPIAVTDPQPVVQVSVQPQPIRNVNREPVPSIGGITSRELFRELLGRPVDRGGVPNRWWLLASIALIIAGVAVVLA